MRTIGQLSVGTELSFWINYRPGVYYYNFDGNYPLVDSVFLTDVPTIANVTSIGAVFANTESLIEVNNVDALTTAPSFYYDQTNNMLYVRLPEYNPPNAYTITAGPNYAFADGAYIDEATGTEYESRLRSSINITRKKDEYFFGTITYNDFAVLLDNADGELYDVQEWDVYGQALKLLYGDSQGPASAFNTLITGRVKEYTFGPDDIEFAVQDTRRVLDKSLPVTTLDAVTYPNIDRDEGKTVPVVYGECRSVPCHVLNDGASPANYQFVCADVANHSNGINAINTVYVDGVATTATSKNTTTATFEISSSNYEAGQKVTADVEGIIDDDSNYLTNPLDILKDMIVTYIGLDYNSAFFDVDTWDRATTGKPSCGYAAVKQVNIARIAEEIGASLLEGITITPDNKLSWLTHDDADAPVFGIKKEDWFDTPSVEFSSDEALSSATVQYNREWDADTFQQVVNDDNFAEFLQTFKGPQDRVFETVLVNESDAEDFAEELVNSYSGVQIYINGSFSLDLTNPPYGFSLFDLQPGDNVDLEVESIEIRDGRIYKTKGDFIGRVKAEVIEFVITPETQSCFLRARYIEPYETAIVDAEPVGYGVVGYGYVGQAGVINV